MKGKKITVVGIGHVGLEVCATILNRDICGSLAMISPNEDKLKANALDFQQGSAFHGSTQILASSKYDVSADSDFVVVTAGVPPHTGGKRADDIDKCVAMMKSIIPQVIKHSPDATIIIVTNPCDIMTAIASKIAGPSFPPGQIFGTGSSLDSSRLRSLIANSAGLVSVIKIIQSKYYCIMIRVSCLLLYPQQNTQHIHLIILFSTSYQDTESVQGFIIGEHGPSSIPVWSSVRLGALALLNPGEESDETLKAIHKHVVDEGWDIVSLKGASPTMAIAMVTSSIAKMILTDKRSIIPVSTCIRGLYGVENDVFLSFPCCLSSKGVRRIQELPLSDDEQETFRKSAEDQWEIQKPFWDSLDQSIEMAKVDADWVAVHLV